MSFGVMGGALPGRWATRTFVTNMVDYGMDVQAAIDAPRMFFEGEVTPCRARRSGCGGRRTESARPWRRMRAAPLGGARPSSSTGSAES